MTSCLQPLAVVACLIGLFIWSLTGDFLYVALGCAVLLIVLLRPNDGPPT